MKCTFPVSLVCLALGVSSLVSAQVSLDDVVTSVQAHHPLLLAEMSQVDAAAGEARAARGELDLTLTAQARSAPLGYYDPQRADILLEQPTTLLGATLYAGYRIGRGKIAPYYGEQATLEAGEVRGGLRLPLWQDRAIDARRAGIRSTEAGRDAADASLREARIDLEREAAVVYFSWVAAGLREGVADELLRLASERDAQIGSKVALGALPAIEQLDNQRAIMDRTQRLVQARRTREKLGLELSLYLRDEAGRPRVPRATDLPAAITGPGTLPSLSAASDQALRTRPELDAYDALLDQARVELSLAENRVAPRVDVFGEVSKDLGNGPPELTTTLEQPVVEVGAVLSLPLWLRKARGKQEAAAAKLEATHAKAGFVRDKVLYEVRDAYSAEALAVERVAAAKSAAELAEQLAAGERTRLELGATTLLFVNLREQQAADAEASVIDALADWNVAHVRARAAMGDSLARR